MSPIDRIDEDLAVILGVAPAVLARDGGRRAPAELIPAGRLPRQTLVPIAIGLSIGLALSFYAQRPAADRPAPQPTAPAPAASMANLAVGGPPSALSARLAGQASQNRRRDQPVPGRPPLPLENARPTAADRQAEPPPAMAAVDARPPERVESFASTDLVAPREYAADIRIPDEPELQILRQERLDAIDEVRFLRQK